jgi:glycosidase
MMLPSRNVVNLWADTLPTSFTAVGDFQGWNNADPNTMLLYMGNGIYRLAYDITTPGNYIGKITSTGTWRSFGADGRSVNAANVNFSTTTANQTVIFLLDTNLGRIWIGVNQPGTGNWCIAGSFQWWDNSNTPLYDDGTNGDLIGGDGVFSLDYTISTSGRNEWKAVVCGDWGTAYPSDNAWVVTGSDNQSVKFTFDTNDHANDAGLPFQPAKNIVNAWDTLPESFNAVGDFQGWNNADPAALLTDLGNGTRILNYVFSSPGTYQGKVTSTGGWDNQYGADGRNKNAPTINFQVFNPGDIVQFLLDTNQGRLAIVAPPSGGPGPDDNIDYLGLGHDSRDGLFRVPFGAINPGDELTLRFRTIHNDVTGVSVRFWDTNDSREFYREMSVAAEDVPCFDDLLGDASCDFWQLRYTPADLTTLYYRFIVVDGKATAYYADDQMMDGGWGEARSTLVDNSYAVTVYDPDFEVVDWMQDGVAYQIFPDRFRDMNKGNTVDDRTPRYGYPDNLDDKIILKDWNDLPEGYCRFYDNPAEPCTEGPRGRDYFGGDLSGIIEKLPYLNKLGVKVIYVNPIFEAGSNHNYDTQDYYLIENFFGDTGTFIALAEGAHRRGMKVILDGVFNHVSSDSPYFDRYGHFDTVGACESMNSPYRDWFYFHDVTPGTGACIGSAGPNSTNYDSWFGFDSIPVLNKNNQEVKDLIYDTNEAIARYWLNLGADGWRLDVMPDSSFPPGFWQEFREAVLEVKPDAIIVGELWKKGDVLPFIHGDTADTTMNYRFRNAVLGFFGTVDNKGFPDDGQSNQPPSLFVSKLESVREDYPDATYYTLMNLLGSHDTQRILWNLTPGENNREEKEFNPDNLARGKELLRLAAIVQMTIPGAPTIYYGDEVGVTGDDDPDDRRTFPWVDEGSTMVVGKEEIMFNAEGAAGDLMLWNHYRKLALLRQEKPVFREGELIFLLADDSNRTLAYILRSEDDIALVAINRNDTPQTLSIDVTGHMPINASFEGVVGILNQAQAVDGVLTIDLAPLSGVVMVAGSGQDLVKPAAPENLVAEPGNMQVVLSWNSVPYAALYRVLRSPVEGGGYQLLVETNSLAFTDTSVINGQRFYYVVQAVDQVGNYGTYSTEAAATPYYPIGWAGLQWPPSISKVLSVDPTENIYGQVYVPGITNSGGDPEDILAQVGFGAPGSDPSTWMTWIKMAHNSACGGCGNNYEYMGTLRPEVVGTYDYLVRFSTDNGIHWTYGYWSDGTPGDMTITPNPDTTPPDAPQSLRVVDWSANYIDLAWDPVSDAAEYWLYRSTTSGVYADPLVKLSATELFYRDSTVDSGVLYFYVVRAVDHALNLSPVSAEVSQVAEPKEVAVTFRVLVPNETPQGDTVYLVGNISILGPWNPGIQPMTDLGGGVWEVTVSILDGTNLEYKYTRGNWDRVEWWGSIVSVANRRVTITYGTDGTQVVDNTATNWGDGPDDEKAVQFWRDPLVESTFPSDDYVGDAPAEISVVFRRAIQPLADSDFSNSVQVERDGSVIMGTVTSPDDTTLIWTPDIPLGAGTYLVTVFNVRSDLGNDSVPMPPPYIQENTLTREMRSELSTSQVD